MTFRVSDFFASCGIDMSGAIQMPVVTRDAMVDGLFADEPFRRVNFVANFIVPGLESHGTREDVARDLTVARAQYRDESGHSGLYELLFNPNKPARESAELRSFRDDGAYTRVNYAGQGLTGSVTVGKMTPEVFIQAGQSYFPHTMTSGGPKVVPNPTSVQMKKGVLVDYLGIPEQLMSSLGSNPLISAAIFLCLRFTSLNLKSIGGFQFLAADGNWYDLVDAADEENIRALMLDPTLLEKIPEGVGVYEDSLVIRAIDRERRPSAIEVKLSQTSEYFVEIVFGYPRIPENKIPLGPIERDIFNFFDVWGLSREKSSGEILANPAGEAPEN